MSDEATERTRASLLERLKRTNETLVWNRAWEEFYATYSPQILAWCRRWGLQATDAEDVAAGVLAVLGRRMDSFDYDPGYRFRGWLKTVVANEIRGFLAKRSRRSADQGEGGTNAYRWNELRELETSATDLADDLCSQRKVLSRAIEEVRGRVQQDTWLAFERTTMLGQSPQQVAADLGISIAAVYKHKSRVLEHLRSTVDQFRSRATHA